MTFTVNLPILLLAVYALGACWAVWRFKGVVSGMVLDRGTPGWMKVLAAVLLVFLIVLWPIVILLLMRRPVQ